MSSSDPDALDERRPLLLAPAESAVALPINADAEEDLDAKLGGQQPIDAKEDGGGRELRTLTRWQVVGFASLQAGMSFLFSVTSGWLAFYYVPPEDSGEPLLLNPAVYSLTLLIGRVLNGLLEPWIGYQSDRLRSRFGRRKPIIFVAAPLAAVTFAMMWFMPFEPLSVGAAAWFVALTFVHNFFSACVMAAYTALLPEVSNDKSERLTIAAAMGVWGMVGNLVVAFIGPLEDWLPDGVDILGYNFSGLQLLCCAMGVVSVLLCWVAIVSVSERPVLDGQISEFSLWREMSVAFGNPSFRYYILMQVFMIAAVMMWQVSFPYLCTVVLETEGGIVQPGKGRTWVGIFSGITLVMAIVMAPVVSALARRFGKKPVLLCAGWAGAAGLYANFTVQYLPDPGVGMLVIMIFVSAALSAIFILPTAVYADVVEQDEIDTGKRREGIYTGVRLLCVRVANGVGNSLAIPILSIGSSKDDYLGIMLIYIFSGTFMSIGTLCFHRYETRM